MARWSRSARCLLRTPERRSARGTRVARHALTFAKLDADVTSLLTKEILCCMP